MRATDRTEQEIMQVVSVSVNIILFGVIVSHIHFVINIITEMADGLGIRVFLIREKKKLLVN